MITLLANIQNKLLCVIKLLNTVYALNKNSEYSDIIRALPSTEKKNILLNLLKLREQRREILTYVSPSLAKL